jgi:hypothetical protein
MSGILRKRNVLTPTSRGRDSIFKKFHLDLSRSQEEMPLYGSAFQESRIKAESKKRDIPYNGTPDATLEISDLNCTYLGSTEKVIKLYNARS